MRSIKCNYLEKKSLDCKPKEKCLLGWFETWTGFIKASHEMLLTLESQFLISRRDYFGSNESISDLTLTSFLWVVHSIKLKETYNQGSASSFSSLVVSHTHFMGLQTGSIHLLKQHALKQHMEIRKYYVIICQRLQLCSQRHRDKRRQTALNQTV